jgi:predicted MFS family arabinose efflux permease
VTARAPEEVAASAPAQQATFREVFAVREFRPLFGTFLLSTAGDELARVALTVLVYQRTNSPLLSALTFAIGHLPWLLGGPLLSALADRLPRHRVLISADAIRAVLLAGMAIPGTPLPVLLGLLFLVSLCAPPFESARSALMADVLEGDRYAVATSLTNITLSWRRWWGSWPPGRSSPSSTRPRRCSSMPRRSPSRRCGWRPGSSADRLPPPRTTRGRARCGRTRSAGCC